MPGMHGTYEANMAMQHCDVLLAVGSRFDDRVIGNPEHFFQEGRKIIHIDIDPASISKRVRVDVPIVGNVSEVLDDMLKLLKVSKEKPISPRLKPGGPRSNCGARLTALNMIVIVRSLSRNTSSRNCGSHQG